MSAAGGAAGEPVRVAAVDLGATSGRVMAGTVGPNQLDLVEVHRFANAAVRVRGSLLWDVLGLYREMLAGLARVAATGPVHAVGVDGWGVDYGLLDRDGHLVGEAFSHRDARTEGVAERVARHVSPAELYAITGVPQLSFNTINQLVAARGTAALEASRTLLLLPDLLTYWLTGEIGAERTNASTTQLYDITTASWSRKLLQRLDLPPAILPPLRTAGTTIGPVVDDAHREMRTATAPPVIAVGSHDTASAVVGVPAVDDDFAFISSGTWSLVGLETDRPVLTDAALHAGFSNEAGVDDRILLLKNVMGLWTLSEAVRTWRRRGISGTDLVPLLAAAGDAPPLRTVVDIDDPRLLAPGDMSGRIAELAQESDQPVPDSPAAVTRCILDSLALAYRRHVRQAADLAQRRLAVVHLVGGGARNHLLCQLTADAVGLPVLAGPEEAAAVGNVLVQARTLGADLPDLCAMRTLVRRTSDLRRHQPRTGVSWDRAEARLPGRPCTDHHIDHPRTPA